MIFSKKNVLVKLNGNNLFVNSADLETSANLSPLYLEGDRHSFYYATQGNVEGSLRLSYYLTGADSLKSYFSDELTAISGNIGNIYFASGYLSSYLASFKPNEPIEINANILIFNAFTGTFTSSSAKSPSLQALNTSDITFYNLNNNTPLGNVYGAEYKFTAEVKPVYYEKTGIGVIDVFPNRVFYGQKQVSLDLITDSTTGHLPIYGRDAAARISAANAEGIILENFGISGKIFNATFNFGNNTSQKVTINQHRVNEIPTISSFSPTLAQAGDTITIQGTNLNNVLGVFVNDESIPSFTVDSSEQVRFILSPVVNSGYIKVQTFEQPAVSATKLAINYPNITIDSFSPTNLVSGNSILINGNNFYKINSVNFNNTLATSFNVLSPTVINAVVPGRIVNGSISVGSVSRTKTGISASTYSAFPVIDSFNPKSGIVGSSFLLSGANFSDVLDVQINNYSASYVVDNTGQITVTVPAVDTLGYVTVENSANQVVYSPYKFEPYVLITGLSLKSGIAGTAMTISGLNFQSYLLNSSISPYGTDYYNVSFNGVNTGFYLINSWTLTGQVPKGAKSGPVYIFKSDGASTYNSTGNFIYINDAAGLSLNVPSGISSGDSLSLSLVGDNLVNLTRVYLTGYNSGNASGFGIVVWDKNYSIISPTADTVKTRRLNTSGQNDLLGLAATFKHILNTSVSLSGNAMLTGLAVKTGLYNLYVESAGGTGIVTGALQINPLTNLAQIDSTKSYLSSVPTGDEINFTLSRFTDDNTGTYGTTASFPRSFVKLAFSSTCQIFDIQLRIGPYTYPSLTTGYLELTLLTGETTGSFTGIAFSGICTGLPNSIITSGYGLNTGTASWRYEANGLLIRSHRINGPGTEISYPLALSDIKIYGIQMTRTGSV